MKRYLHLGNDVVISIKDVIGIFDMDKTSISKYTKEYLKISQKTGKVVNVSYELPKSFVVTRDKVYICQLSPATLRQRAGFF